MTAAPTAVSLDALEAGLVRCRLCPRLVAWREEVAALKRAAYRGETYWGRPVPGFGDPQARIVLLGLAPGAHGSTTRARVHRRRQWTFPVLGAVQGGNGASQPNSVSRDDGTRLTGVRILSPVRCAPPENRPTPEEFRSCRPWFVAELALLPHRRVTLVQGHLAHAAYLRSQGWPVSAYPTPSGTERNSCSPTAAGCCAATMSHGRTPTPAA